MRKAYFQMHLAILLWGFTGIFGKAISMNETMIVWYRMIISAAALAIIVVGRKKFILPNRSDLLKIAATGIIVTLHWITFYGSIKASNVSIALACFSSIALFSAIQEPLLYGKKINISQVLLGIMVMIGIYIIFSFQKFYLKGILLSLLSAFLGSLFTVINKKFVSRIEPGVVTITELLSGFAFLSLLLPLLIKTGFTEFQVMQGYDVVWMLLLSIFCTSFAFTISLEALKKVSVFTMNLSVNLEPVYSIVLAIILFKEDKMLNTGFYVGTLIVISSVVIHTLYQYRNSKKGADDYLKSP